MNRPRVHRFASKLAFVRLMGSEDALNLCCPQECGMNRKKSVFLSESEKSLNQAKKNLFYGEKGAIRLFLRDKASVS